MSKDTRYNIYQGLSLMNYPDKAILRFKNHGFEINFTIDCPSYNHTLKGISKEEFRQKILEYLPKRLKKRSKDEFDESCLVRLPIFPYGYSVGIKLAILLKNQTIRDLDNMTKFILDSLKGIFYQDDRQITELIAYKRQFSHPAISILIYEDTWDWSEEY